MRFLLMVLLAAVVGCAGDLERSVAPAAVVEEDSGVPRAKTRAEEDARAALADRGISFTGASFVEWAGTGDLSVVELFVEGGMPVDAAFGGWTALHEAARNGHLSVVRYLTEQGADVLAVTESGRSVLDVALQGGHTEVVLYIPRAARAALDRLGIEYTAGEFVNAAAEGNVAVVKLFVAAGMSVDARDRALHYAASRGHLEVVAFLVDAGADLEARDEYNWTALSRAAWRGQLGVVKFLVGAGASLTATDNYGHTALHEAADEGHLEVVEFLVGAGADVNARNEFGRTPRDEAADEGHTDVVEYFDSLDDDG